jgi:predicted aspartyl protease
MGHVWVDARLVNVDTGREVRARALVDTGATFTIVPWWVHERLGFKVVGRRSARTAKGYAEFDESFALVEVEGRRAVVPILISRELKDVLMGVITLEALGLEVDPTTGKLKETEILLLRLGGLYVYRGAGEAMFGALTVRFEVGLKTKRRKSAKTRTLLRVQYSA